MPSLETTQDIIDCISEGVILTDSQGRIIRSNQRAEEILGEIDAQTAPSEWGTRFGLFLPDGLTPFPSDRLPLVQALSDGTVSQQTVTIRNTIHPTGITLCLTARPRYEPDGAVAGAVMTLCDHVNGSGRDENENPHSARFATLVERMRSGILVEDENRRILFANQPLCDLFNITAEPDTLVGADCSASANQVKSMFREPEAFARRVEDLIRDKTPVFGEALELSDGRVFERDYIPVFDNGDFRGHIWKYRDISDRLAAQRTMKVLERLGRAVEQTADSVVITDHQGHIEYVNPAFETTTGYARDEVLGRSPAILKSGQHEPEFYRDLWEKILAGQTFEGAIVNRKKSGEFYSSQQTITPVRDDEGNITHFVSVLKDMTESLKRQELEFELRLARKVQQRLYGNVAQVPGYDVAGTALPLGATGGDYFDFIPMPDGSMGVVIADVCSHGMAAALVMAQIRAYLRSFALHSSDPGEIVTQLNRALVPDLRDGHFVTLLLARICSATRSMSYASTGHLPAFLLRTSAETDLVLESTGPPIGLQTDLEYESSGSLPFLPGQILLLITDGVTDAMALEDMELGMSRAVAFVRAHGHEPAHGITEGLCQRARDSAKAQRQLDDITSVVVKAI